jgi:hypothetical protein
MASDSGNQCDHARLIGLGIPYVMPHYDLGRNDFVHFYIGGLLYGTRIHSAEVNQRSRSI